MRQILQHRYVNLVIRTFAEFFKEASLMHAASLAYFTLFALIPLLYLSITFFGRIIGQSMMVEIITDLLQEKVGIQDVSGILDFLQQVDLESGNFWLEIIGLATLLISCTAFLVSLKRSLNDFFDLDYGKVAKKRLLWNNIIFRLISVGIVGTFGIIIIVLYFAQTVLISYGQDIFQNDTASWFFSEFIQHGVAIFSNMIIFSLIFKFVHDGIVTWKLAIVGSFVTSILLYVGQLLIKYYLINYFFGSGGGIAGTLFILLAWVYYSSQIIFLGAKFTLLYGEMIGNPIRNKFKTQEEIDNSIL